MAKEQNISLNPSKISGNCGRLMCCLKYEQDVYEDKLSRIPKVGSIVKTEDGEGIVESIETLKEIIRVRCYTYKKSRKWRRGSWRERTFKRTTRARKVRKNGYTKQDRWWYIINKRCIFREVKNMAYKITDKCISCGACAQQCPVECIAQGEGKYVIDPEQCIECGTCAGVCPVEAPELAE